MLWDSIRGDSNDDQVLLNYALKACNIHWQAKGKTVANQSITGQCPDTKLKVTVLPHSEICRYDCGTEGYHVWHRLSKKKPDLKKRAAMRGGRWYLKDNWRSLGQTERGKVLKDVDWLTLISVS